jgi:hypothetical protein
MKKFFTTLMMIIWVSYLSYGQIVITEISYNPPESGTDSLEYIEIFNAGTSDINIKDYKFTKGIDYTFPDTLIKSNTYFLIVKNARAFKTVYNVTAADWSPDNPISTSNTLTNNGEVLEITDATAKVLISFKYEKIAPWPTFTDGTDGAGGSIELCDAKAVPTIGSNWKTSTNDLGFEVNAKKVFGTPGKANSITVCSNNPPIIDLYPLRTIPQMKGVNAEGVADSLNKKCSLKGIVHGVNFRISGLQFTIIDGQNKGFGVFNNSTNLGYTVKEGDEIMVKGGITQFRGLSQIVADSIKVLSTNNNLVAPKTVTELTETDESSLIRITNLNFVNPSEWKGAGTGFTVNMTNGTKEFPIRITNAIDAFSMPIPSGGPFNVVGILNQFSGTSAPFNSGYQLQPRYMVDFRTVSSTENTYTKHAVSLVPNPATHLVEINTVETPDAIEVMDIQGQKIMSSTLTKSIDLSQVHPGMYLFRVTFGQQSTVLKLIKM